MILIQYATRNKVTWHKGMPKALHGRWYGKGMVLIVNNKHVYFIPVTGSSVSKQKNIQFRKITKNSYRYRVGKHGYSGVIKKLNKHTAKLI